MGYAAALVWKGRGLSDVAGGLCRSPVPLHHSAAVRIEDRGYQFANGVYEVMAVAGGSLLDEGLT